MSCLRRTAGSRGHGRPRPEHGSYWRREAPCFRCRHLTLLTGPICPIDAVIRRCHPRKCRPIPTLVSNDRFCAGTVPAPGPGSAQLGALGVQSSARLILCVGQQPFSHLPRRPPDTTFQLPNGYATNPELVQNPNPPTPVSYQTYSQVTPVLYVFRTAQTGVLYKSRTAQTLFRTNPPRRPPPPMLGSIPR
jgi:hypothetical protein